MQEAKCCKTIEKKLKNERKWVQIKVKVLDLFSGIGGFSLGLERAGFETVAFCELEDYPVSILNKHWPDVPVHRDIRKLDGKQYRGTVRLVCGGFPCQPFSVAGKQAGEEDDRHLWPEMLRIIKEVQPDYVIGENVAGFISMALDDVLSDLEGEGYRCEVFVLPACAVGGIHRRDRCWIVGERIATNTTSEGLERDSGGIPERQGFTRDSEDATNTSGEGLQGEPITGSNGRIREKSRDKQSAGCGSSYEFRPIEPPTQSPVRHRDDGLPDNVARLKALGNSVVPQIPELIGRAIKAIECK